MNVDKGSALALPLSIFLFVEDIKNDTGNLSELIKLLGVHVLSSSLYF